MNIAINMFAGNLPPSGQYEINITSLEPGPHLFIITLDDGYGKSVMKIHPFFIGTGTGIYMTMIMRLDLYIRKALKYSILLSLVLACNHVL